MYMDDLTTTTETIVQSQYLLDKLNSMLQWGRLQVKPQKCRSMVIIRGQISKHTVTIGGARITSITEKPLKYLGKEYNLTMSDKRQVQETTDKVKIGLKRIEKCHMPGRYKEWILQHMLLPRIMWPLTIYAVPTYRVEKIQMLLTGSLKRWLGLPKCMSGDVIYSSSVPLQLPYSSVVEEVKAARARSLVTMQQSEDRCIHNAGINLDVGRKWKVSEAVEDAKSRLRLQDIAGIANIGREGLGVNHRQYFSTSTQKEKRGLVVQMVRKKEEEDRTLRIAGLRKQGACTKWEVKERQLSHREIITSSEKSLRFLIKCVYDLLPTPANKNTWYNTDENKCALCGGMGTLNHILSGCRVALQQGRYRWRHDKVLRVIAAGIEEKRRTNNKLPAQKRRGIMFVKAGTPRQPAHHTPADSYLNSARDWRMQVDLGKRLQIPAYIYSTDLRPDIMLISDATKQIAFIELTVPGEERIEISSELKKNKYAVIEEACNARRWRARIWAVEVGARGFPAPSMSSCLKEFGFAGKEKKSFLRRIGIEAESASHNMWRWSHHKSWGHQG